MKLWLIFQLSFISTLDSVVVSAETEEEAKNMYSSVSAVSVANVGCEYLGEAKVGTSKQVIHASCIAG